MCAINYICFVIFIFLFTITKVLYCTSGGLYMGGYKAGLNIENLKNKKVGLVVCTAGGLERVLGPKYKQQVKNT